MVYSPYQNLFCVSYILSRIRMSVPGCRHRCWCICCGCHNTQTRPTIDPRSKSSGTIPIYPLRQGQIEKGKEDTHRNHHPIRVHLSGAPPFQGVFPESKCDVTCVIISKRAKKLMQRRTYPPAHRTWVIFSPHLLPFSTVDP